MTATDNDTAKPTFETRQAKRGYILAYRLADLMGKHHSTIYRWIGQQKIKAEKIEERQWVHLLSVRDYLGETAFKTYGLDKVHARMKNEGIAAGVTP